jgi:uncharacterized protein YkwD
MIAANEAIRGDGIVRPARHAQRTGLIRRRVAWAFGLLVLTVLTPLAALAQERTSAWQTQTIPEATVPAPTPAAAPAVHVPPAAPPKQLTALERQAVQTIEITNAFRRRNGLPEFKEDPVCSAAAFDHAQDMARRSYFDHFGPGGTSPTSRYKRRNTAGQRVIRVTENIARGNGTTPESALRMWLDSSGTTSASVWPTARASSAPAPTSSSASRAGRDLRARRRNAA